MPAGCALTCTAPPPSPRALPAASSAHPRTAPRLHPHPHPLSAHSRTHAPIPAGSAAPLPRAQLPPPPPSPITSGSCRLRSALFFSFSFLSFFLFFPLSFFPSFFLSFFFFPPNLVSIETRLAKGEIKQPHVTQIPTLKNLLVAPVSALHNREPARLGMGTRHGEVAQG